MAKSKWTQFLALLILVAIFGFVAWYLAGRHDAVRGAQQNGIAPNGPSGNVVPPPGPLQLWADAERQRAVAILLQAALERGTTKPEWALAIRANPSALESAKKFLRWHIKEGPLAQRSLGRALLLDVDEQGELPKVLAECALSGRDANQAARNVLTAHASVFPGRRHTPEFLDALSKAKPVDVSFWLDVLKPADDPRAVPAVMESKSFEIRTHFGQFVRVQLGPRWYRVGNYADWKIHYKFHWDAVQQSWDSEGSAVSADNNGF